MTNRNKQLLVATIVGGVIALSSASLVAGEYELGLEAFNKGQYSKAFRIMEASAKKGKVKAQFILSTMYRRGLGVEADEYQAFEWCKKAAEEEFPEAQFQLGLMYLHGEGVTDDNSEAQKWLWAAADQGYPQASEVLTYIYSAEYNLEHEIGC